MLLKTVVGVATFAFVVGSGSTASALWVPSYQVYSIQRIGLFGPEHTGILGLQDSWLTHFSTSGVVSGQSTRFTGVSNYNGFDTWVYNPVFNATVQTGLTGAAWSGNAGYQYSKNEFQNDAAQVAGYSYRYIGTNTQNGQNTWVYNPVTNTTVQTGLTGAANTGSAGYQFSANLAQYTSGHVVGYSERYTGVNTNYGRNTWIYNSVIGTTVQTGLTGAAWTGSSGFQVSNYTHHNQSGQLAGYSERYSDEYTNKGRNTWVYNPLTNTTVQTGLTGTSWTGSSGAQYSTNNFQNAGGQVAGSSDRFTGTNTRNGVNTWVYNPVTNTTVQTGLTGTAWTGSDGHQSSKNQFQNDAGQVAGTSDRYTGVFQWNGQNSWVFNPVTGTTVQTGLTGTQWTGISGWQASDNRFQNAAGHVAGVSERASGGFNTWAYNPHTNTTVLTGLTGAAWTGSAGRQESYSESMNQAGQVVGYSNRYLEERGYNGRSTWVYNPATGTTVQTGLTGADWTGSSGYQESRTFLQNEAGQVAGASIRIIGAFTDNGANAWVYNPVSNTTVLTGLTGAEWTGSEGYQVSYVNYQNAAGQVVGSSRRISGVGGLHGENTWVYDPMTSTTTKTGLTGAANTGSTGYQFSKNQFQNASGQIVGVSNRYTGVNNENGQNTWVYNPVTRDTVQTGLTGPTWTNSWGFQYSEIDFQNDAGQVVGHSRRMTDNLFSNGQDAWYYDPSTNVTIPVIGSVRTRDNYASSRGTILTDSGFLLGNYAYFFNGTNSYELRAFIFRPDLGLTDLGSLVNGGLTASGWSTLQQPIFSDALDTLVGYGYVNGQTNGRSIFVMTIPMPGATGLLALGGLLVLRRPRR